MKLTFLLTVFLTGFAGQPGSLVEQAPLPARTRVNPFDGDPEAARAGAKLFARQCASCHGSKAGGIGKAPPLASTDLAQTPSGALFWVLRNGSLQRGMPSFAHLPEARRWQIITYLRTLPIERQLNR